jgi:polyhydroxybutyrate depolymerase
MRFLVAVVVAAACCGPKSGHAQIDDASPPGDLGADAATNDAAAPDAAKNDSGSSLGCGVTGQQTGDFHLQTTDGTGASRDYEVMVPSTYSPTTPLAVTFLYHGAGGDEASAVRFGLQNAPGAATASIFVFPQGAPYQGYGVGWDDSCSGYDMVFFDNMLAYLKANYCIDTTKVFAAGFSWGCDYVTALRCCRGDRIRAIAAASCSDDFSDTSNYQTYTNLPCPVSGSSAIRFTHDANGDTGYSLQCFTTTSALYRSFNGCSASSVPASVSPCVSYQSCAEPFIECAYDGLGHTLPGTWASDTWDFFSTLP